MKLVTKERILVHLHEYQRFENDFEVPYALSQEGIAEAVVAPRAHVSAVLKQMQNEGIVKAKLVHVSRGFRRKNAYFLTDTGKGVAKNLIESIKRDDPLLLEMPEKLFGKEKEVKEERKSAQIYGREKEISIMCQFLGNHDTNILVIYGMPGIGKTHLLNWFSTVYGCAYIEIPLPLNSLAEFYNILATALAKKGRFRLKRYLQRNSYSIDVPHLAMEEAKGLVLCIDNAHNLNTLSELKMGLQGVKFIFAAREKLGFYQSSDVASGKVIEVWLSPLDEIAAGAFLSANGINDAHTRKEIFEEAKGHPLMMLLLAKGGRNANWKYLFEEIFSKLNEKEKHALKILALLKEGVEVERIAGIEALVKLENLGLVYYQETYRIQEVLRPWVLASIPEEERKTLGRELAMALEKIWGFRTMKERVRILLDTGNLEDAGNLIVQHYSEFVASGEIPFLEGTIRVLGENFRPEMKCIRGELCVRKGEWECAVEILKENGKKLSRFWRMEREYILARAYNLGARFREAVEISEKGYRKYRHPKFLLVMGRAYEGMGERKKALEIFLDALSKGAEQGITLAEIGNLLIEEGDYAHAADYFERAVNYTEDGGMKNKIKINLAIALSKTGKTEMAVSILREVMDVAREWGEQINYGFACVNLSHLMLESGDALGAEKLASASLEIAKNYNLPYLLAPSFINLGKAQICNGKTEEGSANIENGEKIYRELGNRMLE
ncbi:MAG: AAA family ATPase [Thermoplasmata archaeon]